VRSWGALGQAERGVEVLAAAAELVLGVRQAAVDVADLLEHAVERLDPGDLDAVLLLAGLVGLALLVGVLALLVALGLLAGGRGHDLGPTPRRATRRVRAARVRRVPAQDQTHQHGQRCTPPLHGDLHAPLTRERDPYSVISIPR
jgi:hypothetical protein